MQPEEFKYYIKVLLPFVIICVCLLNISLQTPKQKFWFGLLFTSLGHLIPNPKLKIFKSPTPSIV